MNARDFYWPNIMRKVNLAMLGLFGGLQVAKQNKARQILEYRDVPVRFAHRQKFIPLLTANREGNMTFFYQNLPIAGLMIKNMAYAPNKIRGGYEAPVYRWYNELNSAHNQIYSGTPYTISYQLSILSLTMREMTQILEQLLPWFNPYRNITIQEWDFLPELTRDLKVTLKGTTPTFADDVTEEQIKKVEFTLDFDIDCFFYKPIPIVELIKTVKIPLVDWGTTETIPPSSDVYTYSVSGDNPDAFNILRDDWTFSNEI